MFALAHPGRAGLQCSCGPISHRSPGRRARLGVLSPHEEARKVRMWPGSSTCPLGHAKNGNRTQLQPCASASHMPHWPHQSLGPQNFSISCIRQLLCSVNKVLGWDPLGLQEAFKALLYPPAVVADPDCLSPCVSLSHLQSPCGGHMCRDTILKSVSPMGTGSAGLFGTQCLATGHNHTGN